MRRILVVVPILALMAGFVYAKGLRGTAPEAVKMVDKAVELIVSEGQEKAFKQISDPKGAFVDRDLYVYVVDMRGTILAHSGDQAMIGKDMIDVRDMDGKAFIRDLIREARVKDTGWVDYKWPHPITGLIEEQSRYYKRIGDLIVTCGIHYLQTPFET